VAIVGYARVSTVDQSLSVQVEQLEKAGCTTMFTEQVSGISKKGRNKLKECLNYLRKGDTLIITRVDRLARSMFDLQSIVRTLNEKEVELKATEQPIDTSTPAGKAFFDMLGVFAEFETNLRKERQMEGIAKAKAAGKYKGAKPTARVKTKDVMEMFNKGTHKNEIAVQLGMSLASVYRIIRANKKIEVK
jgi:DNA invertase Pin-like site-specific DNA recombinase